MKTSHQLREERAVIREQMRDIVRNAEKEGREITAEEQARFDKFDQDFEALTVPLNQALTRERVMAEEAERIHDDFEKRQRESNGDTGGEKDARKAQERAFWKFMKNGPAALNQDELRALNSIRGTAQVRGTATQITTTDSLGGYLIPQGFSGELEKAMKYYSGMMDACRILRTETGELITWPTVDDTAVTGSLTSEASPSIAVSDLTFAEKELNAYTYDSGIIKVSVQLLQDSFFDLESEVRGFFAERLGRKANADLTTADGSSKPYGLVTAIAANASRLQSSADNATISRDDIVNVMHKVDRAYRNPASPNCGWMFSDGILAELKKLSFGSSDDRPLWQPSMREGEPDTLEGYRYWVNNDMASSISNGAYTMIFGDFNKYIIRMVQDMVMVPLRELYMASLQVGYISYMRLDGELLQPKAFAMLRQINT